MTTPRRDHNCERIQAGDIRGAAAVSEEWAGRIVQATLEQKEAAQDALFDEIPSCAMCYRHIVIHLANKAAVYLEAVMAVPPSAQEAMAESDPEATQRAIESVERWIDSAVNRQKPIG